MIGRTFAMDSPRIHWSIFASDRDRSANSRWGIRGGEVGEFAVRKSADSRWGIRRIRGGEFAQASVTLCVCFKLTIRLLAYIDSSILLLHSQILQEFPRESQWRTHHGEFTMGKSPWIWFPGHSSWIHQFAWGKESDSPRGIPHGEFSCGEFMWIFPVNSPQVSNEQYCTCTSNVVNISWE